MHNWDDLRYFLSVARHGSFSAAAERLSVNGSTVGRRIDQLENDLGESLFERQRHGMVLTPKGRQLLDHVQQMEEAAQKTKGQSNQLKGRVRISTNGDLASFWLSSRLFAFFQSYPDISLQLTGENRLVDLTKSEADLAICLQEPSGKGLETKKVGVLNFHVFASPNYLETYGFPSSWSDLSAHRLIDYAGYHNNRALALWQEKLKHHDRVVLQADQVQSYVSALRSGLGLGLLPKFFQHSISDLILVDLPTELFSLPIYLVSPQSNQAKAEVTATKEYIAHLFERDRKLWFS